MSRACLSLPAGARPARRISPAGQPLAGVPYSMRDHAPRTAFPNRAGCLVAVCGWVLVGLIAAAGAALGL